VVETPKGIFICRWALVRFGGAESSLSAGRRWKMPKDLIEIPIFRSRFLRNSWNDLKSGEMPRDDLSRARLVAREACGGARDGNCFER
jgi:hypothetical protein